MQYSTNYNMNKPELNEQYRLSHWNENTDIIDTELKRNADNISDEVARASDAESALRNITDSTFKTALLNFCYPIGSIYWSGDSTDPHDLFGGTWVQIKDCFVWAKGDNDTLDATGGEKTHTLTTAEMPTHKHTFTGTAGTVSVSGGNHTHQMPHATNSGGSTGYMGGSSPDWRDVHVSYSGNLSMSGTFTPSGSIGNKGDGGAHNNMPPYIVKYCWQRTA